MPSASAKQHRAMEAAAHGHSTLGIPKKVGAEFARADDAANANGIAAGVVFVAPDGNVLLLLRSAMEPNFGGHWSLPGGKGDDGETPLQAAMRECAEEIGEAARHAWLGEPTLISEDRTATGMTFSTFVQPCRYKFVPELNEEHSGFVWVAPEAAPTPLHPAVAETLRLWFGSAEARAEDAMAVDRGSDRNYDADGRMHVTQTPISKANVCEYKGSEIPGAAAMGLQPDRRYKLYRDPGELAKGASTFNLLPVLRRHVATSADDHQAVDTVGATGTDAAFEAPYLVNSMVIWPQADIDGVVDGDKKELSSAYRYRADMTPGITDTGEQYDGVMRDIVGNHVALVVAGRAGHDVLVADEKPMPENGKGKFATDEGMPAATASTTPNAGIPMGGRFKNSEDAEEHPADCDCAACVSARDESETNGTHANDSKEPAMAKIALTPKAMLAQGALMNFLAPRLAEDAAIDLPAALKDVNNKNYVAKRPLIVKRITDATKDHLAADAKLDGLDDCLMAFDAMDLPEPGGGKGAGPANDRKTAKDKKMGRDEKADALKESLKEKFGADEAGYKAACDEIDGMMGDDEDDDKKKAAKEAEDKRAKDEAEKEAKAKEAEDEEKMKTAMDEALTEERANNKAIREAERFVTPWVGQLQMAFDSANDVYAFALKARGKDPKNIHPSAYKDILEMLPKPGTGAERRTSQPALAMDAAISKDLSDMYPGFDAVRVGGGINL